MMYLEKQTVMNSIKDLANGIENMYSLESSVQVYIEESEDPTICYLGYSFVWQGKRTIIKMKHFVNEVGAIAVDRNNGTHIIEIEGKENTGFKTLGEAFNELGMSKK